MSIGPPSKRLKLDNKVKKSKNTSGTLKVTKKRYTSMFKREPLLSTGESPDTICLIYLYNNYRDLYHDALNINHITVPKMRF